MKLKSKAYFAGGLINKTTDTNIIDVYDSNLAEWTNLTLPMNASGMVAASLSLQPNVNQLRAIPAPFIFDHLTHNLDNELSVIESVDPKQTGSADDPLFKDFDYCSDAMKKEMISLHRYGSY